MASSGPVLNGSPVLNSNQAAAVAAGMALQAQQVAATDAQLGRGPAKTIVLPARRHRPQVVRARRIVTTDDGTAPVDLVPPGATVNSLIGPSAGA